MKALDWARALEERLERFLEERPDEPVYDPVHLGAAVIITLASLGCLYWLLWTLLVYEGGIFLKLKALGQLLLTKTTLEDLGYEGAPYAMGAFEGWAGNAGALALTVVLVWALRRIYQHGPDRWRNLHTGARL